MMILNRRGGLRGLFVARLTTEKQSINDGPWFQLTSSFDTHSRPAASHDSRKTLAHIDSARLSKVLTSPQSVSFD